MIFRMSEIGHCSKSLTAKKLDYEPLPTTDTEKRIMRLASKHEAWIAEEIAEDTGFELTDAGLCIDCLSEFGEERKGHHVELKYESIRLVGHLDRKIKVVSEHPVEIKALGRFTFDKFKRYGFEAFPHYSDQETCYLEAEQTSGVYVVGCRDTGEVLKYVVLYKTRWHIPRHNLSIEGFKFLETVNPMQTLIDKLIRVEACVKANTLPDCAYNEKSDQCRYCSYKYLCLGSVEEVAKAIEPDLPSLLEASEEWKEGKKLEEQAEEKIEHARSVFLGYAKQFSLEKYQVGGLGINYLGQRVKKYLDEKLIEKEAPELYKKAIKESRPWDDLRVTLREGSK